jgi:L-threonylcarbamoyladenylate synthase
LNYRIVKDDKEGRARAAEIISSGGIVAFLTDTFYGLGADPMNARAVRRVQELKGREASGKPVLIVISDERETLRFIENDSPLFEILKQEFWPGALTIIGKAKTEVPEELTAETGTLGVRLPDDARVRDFVRACGGALTATSANPTSEPPACTAEEVASYFADRIDLIVDRGEAISLEPSTVIDASGEEARLVREGVINRKQLENALLQIQKNLH